MSHGQSAGHVRWTQVAKYLRSQPLGTIVRVRPSRVEHPRDGGMILALSLPVGQRSDYRLDTGDGRSLVVMEFDDAYEAHLEVAPRRVDFERALRETPGTSVIGMAAAGALIGLALGRSRESAMAGAAIAGLAGIAGVGMANAETAPAVTEAATRMLETAKPLTHTRVRPRSLPAMTRRPGQKPLA